MAILDNFSKRVGKVAGDAAAKSRELTDIARFSVNIADERAAIRALYRDLGEKYYQALRSSGLSELQPYCDKIDLANKKINELENKIQQIKGPIENK